MEKISVVMATYNGEKYIEQQLVSILNQTVKPDEIIISDDASKDNTIDIIEKILKNTVIDIKILKNEKNLGYIGNFRNAILNATGDYIFLCDQDDLWEENKIEKTISTMKLRSAAFACTGFRLIDGNGDEIINTSLYKSDPICGYENWTYTVKNVSIKRLIWGNFSPGCTYCFNREILQVYESINNLEVSHDYQLFLIASNALKAIYIDEPLSQYRLHTNNTVGMNQKEKKRERNIKPRLYKFIEELSEKTKIGNLFYIKLILYTRLPMVRFRIIRHFKLNNYLKLES